MRSVGVVVVVDVFVKQVFGFTENGYQLDIEGIKEVDVYILNLNIVIEYDSLYYHENREKIDSSKTESLVEHGYKVIRLREQGLPLIKGSINITFKLGSNSYLERQTILSLLSLYIKNYLFPKIHIRKY